MLCFAQMKLRQAANDVMLRINDVALLANQIDILALLCYNNAKKGDEFILKRYILSFLCIFTMFLLVTSCTKDDVNSPIQNNVNPEYENKINSVICDEYNEYEILGYFNISDTADVLDTVFLVKSASCIDLHTLYNIEGQIYNQCNFRNIANDTVQSYFCVFDEGIEISFLLTAQKQNIPKDSQVYEINGYYFCVVDIRDTNTTYILSPEASKAIMGYTPKDFFSEYLPFYDDCCDLREKATIDDNGNLVLKMSEKDKLAFLSEVYCDIEEFKKIEGVTVSEDYSELIICGSKNEIADIVWNHFPLFLPEYMTRLQFVSGNDPETISATVKVIDEMSGEILYVAVWPKDKIDFDFVDGEFAN